MYSHDAEKNEGYEAEGDPTRAANGLNQYGVIRQNGPGGAVSYTLTYDDNGSLTGDGTWSYAYDVENRLTCAQENGAAPVSWTLGACVFGASASRRAVYQYDPIGRRYRKCVVLAPGSGDPCADVIDGVITEFTSDGVEEVQDVDGLTNAVLMEYIHGPGIDEIAFMADRVNGGAFYLVTDHLGSVVAIQQRNVSSMAEAFHYTAYGEIAAGEESGYPFRFTGRRYDAETGLYYYRARYYAPTLGRFLQTDPIGYGDGLNMYAYVGNDPVNGRDPSGRCPNCVTGAIGAGVGGLFGLVTSVFSELTDDKAGVSFGNIAKATGKGIVVGGVVGFTGNVALGASVAAGLGAIDGAVTAGSVEGSSAGDVVAGALSGAIVEGGASFIGGTAGQKVLGSILKKDVVGNVAGVLGTVALTGATDLTSSVTNVVADGLKTAGQAVSDTFDKALDVIKPTPEEVENF